MSLVPIGPLLWRCYFVVDDPSDPTALDPLRFMPWKIIRQREAKGIARNRWDPIDDMVRSLHFANDEVTAFVEVLQELRMSAKTIDELAELDDPENVDPIADLRERKRIIALSAAHEHLESRYIASVPTTSTDHVYDVMQARTEIEERFGLRLGSLKLGHFTGSDRLLSRKVAEHAFQTSDAVGIYCRSSEGDGFVTALSEDGFETARLRATLGRPNGTVRAMSRTDALTKALRYLGLMDDEPAPSGGTPSPTSTTTTPPV